MAKFGLHESVHWISDTELKGPNGETLFLGYKTSTYFFLLGVYIEDDGYVLGVKGESKKYMSMPSSDKIQLAQAIKLLPSPLPRYSIDPVEYMLGYSLWILIAGVVGWVAIKSVLSKKKA